ncbi:MAG: hypothetical protein O2779_02155 [Nanoarchaeota archaeon]|nr:hypothetical protein [Nanoarchaeota archaeon]
MDLQFNDESSRLFEKAGVLWWQLREDQDAQNLFKTEIHYFNPEIRDDHYFRK